MKHPIAAPGAISVTGIAKRFGTVVAVDDVSLDLPAGSFFSLLGPSGCGKTTLMRMVAGLERPDAGRVIADGVDITGLPPERRPFNMVFQRYALFPHLTIFENVAFGLTTQRKERLSNDELKRRVGEMLELVELGELGGRFPAQISGGQQQRVAVARALIRRPSALLLDEPMSALDRNVRHQIREELLRIHRDLGTTFVLVTHDQDEALSISDTVGLMNHGKLEQVDTPEDMYHRPATLFAARFVGAGSFVEGRATVTSSHEVSIDVSGIHFAAASAGVSTNGAVHILLRPEDLSLTAPGAGRVLGQIDTSAFYGSYHELAVRTDIGVLRLRHADDIAPGTAVGLDWPDVAGIAYPAEPGEAVSEDDS